MKEFNFIRVTIAGPMVESESQKQFTKVCEAIKSNISNINFYRFSSENYLMMGNDAAEIQFSHIDIAYPKGERKLTIDKLRNVLTSIQGLQYEISVITNSMNGNSDYTITGKIIKPFR